MKGARKGGRQQQPDVPIVYDPCGVDVTDPIGNHIVNFTFSVNAKDDPNSTFEGDIELVLPHNLPKNLKPPKIEITKPETNWQSQLQVNIDDNFINMIREKRLMYKCVFLYKTTSHAKGPARGGKRGSEKTQTQVTNHTFFIDASCLLVRGGRFKPFLSYTANCKPPGFSSFDLTISIDHPLLSDAQIRRHQPLVCLFKCLHQLPNAPLTYEELRSQCIGPYIVVKTPTSTFTTVPREHGSEMKLNIALILWTPTFNDLKIELHDRESENPDMSNTIGSSFVIPPEPTQKPVKVEPLSIDQILGSKKETTSRPFGAATISLSSGRKLMPIQPVPTKDTTIQPGFYVEAGTYVSVEIEVMKNTVPVISTPVAVATPTNPKRGAQHTSRQNTVAEIKQAYNFKRCCVVADFTKISELERQFMMHLQERIVLTNALSAQIKDLATVPSMKIDKEDSSAISGFYLYSGDVQIAVLEVLENTESETQLQDYLNERVGNNVKVFFDFDTKFQSPRMYNKFDCAVKKFKLEKPIEQLLLEPEIYVQNSHMSNCFLVMNQLNQIRTAKSFGDFMIYNLWPNSTDLEMLNAKKGALLSLNELAFPPKNLEALESVRSLAKPTVKVEERTTDLKYIPINQDIIDSPPHDVEYFVKRNVTHIEELQRKNAKKRGLVEQSEDGEVEIWSTNDVGTLKERGWSVENPEPYMPLAQAVGTEEYKKGMRQEDGTEVKNGKKFYSFKNPHTVFDPIEQLKADRNAESWKDGDLSLANVGDRWMKNARGPVTSSYTPKVHPKDYFDLPDPISIQEEWKQPCLPGQGSEYVEKLNNHKPRFMPVVAPPTKFEPLLAGESDPEPLTVLEEYKPPLAEVRRDEYIPKTKKRFSAVFPNEKLKKGSTDSLAVRKIVPTFPPIKPGF